MVHSFLHSSAHHAISFVHTLLVAVSFPSHSLDRRVIRAAQNPTLFLIFFSFIGARAEERDATPTAPLTEEGAGDGPAAGFTNGSSHRLVLWQGRKLSGYAMGVYLGKGHNLQESLTEQANECYHAVVSGPPCTALECDAIKIGRIVASRAGIRDRIVCLSCFSA